MSDKSGFSKGKKYITVCGAGYTRSDISDGYLARAQKAEKIIGDKGPLFLTIDPADIDPSKITTGIIQVVNQHKPEVWARKRKNERGYDFCNEKGCVIIGTDGSPIGCLHRANMDILGAKSGFKFRVWTPPEPVWEYAIYKGGLTFKGDASDEWSSTVSMEEIIGKLLTHKSFWEDSTHRPNGAPIFGVRKLTSGVPCVQLSNGYGAYRDGKYIKTSQARDPERCIKNVLEMLTPITPVVTLADLETYTA